MLSRVISGFAGALLATAALADDAPPAPLRFYGEAATAKDPAPRRFVVDAVMKPGDAELQTTLDGWFAQLGGDDPAHGEIEGSCVEKHCTLTVDAAYGKFTLTGDFGALSAPVAARFRYKDENDKVTQQGAASLRPLSGGAVPELGALAPASAIDAAGMDELLMWAGQSVGFGGGTPGEPIGDFQRGALADWQTAKGRAPTGLLFAADLAQLRAEAETARKAAGWTTIGDKTHGWSAAYPAALLPHATRAGAEQRFASADGKAQVAVAIDAPMDGDAFDEFVHRLTEEREGRTGVGYTRVNSDMEIHFEEKGVVTVAAYHNRPGGLARVVFTYPKDQEDRYVVFETLVQRGLVVSDELKR